MNAVGRIEIVWREIQPVGGVSVCVCGLQVQSHVHMSCEGLGWSQAAGPCRFKCDLESRIKGEGCRWAPLNTAIVPVGKSEVHDWKLCPLLLLVHVKYSAK